MSSPHHPGHWQPPAAYPAPPPKKRPVWKIALWSTLAAVALCFGGLVTIGVIVGPPDEPSTTAPAAEGQAVQPLLAATTSPAPSATRAAQPPTAVATSPAARRTTPAARNVPKPTTQRPKPRRTTYRPEPEPTRDEPETVYYKNCDAVRAAGAAPIRRGDPGYAKHLDRDGDGVGCAGD